MRNFFREFFYLQRDDRWAVIALLVVVLIATLLAFWLGSGDVAPDVSVVDSVSVNTRKAITCQDSPSGGYYRVEEHTAELFPFDPNTADSTQLLRLGLAPWQVRSIYRYRAKGGVFRRVEDFARVYGLTRKQYRQLSPYIKISPDYQPAADMVASSYEPYRKQAVGDTATFSKHREYAAVHKLRPGERISLNASDTVELKKIPGVGSGYARMIVAYRERLGGFVDARQLLEVGNVPESVLAYVTVDATSVRKLNLNKLTLNQLRRHPYINFYQAREICDYRRLRGPLRSLDDLKFSADFQAAQLERLRPYVTF